MRFFLYDIILFLESSLQESKLEASVSSSKRTYLVDDPRYLVGVGAALGKQEEVENDNAMTVVTTASEPSSENIGSR